MADWRSEAHARLYARRFQTPRFEHEPWPAADSLQERLKRQRAMFRWAVGQDPDFHVTVQFNDSLDERQASKRLRQFDALLDDYWLGKHWARYASEDRAFFVAFLERTAKGLHAHLLVRKSKSRRRPDAPEWKLAAQARVLTVRFTAMCRAKGVTPRGDVLFQRLATDWDQEQATSYCVKTFDEEWNSRNGFMLSSEFHSKARIPNQGRDAARKVHRDGATTSRGFQQRSHARRGLAGTAASPPSNTTRSNYMGPGPSARRS
jgi:hypothetical protein